MKARYEVGMEQTKCFYCEKKAEAVELCAELGRGGYVRDRMAHRGRPDLWENDGTAIVVVTK